MRVLNLINAEKPFLMNQIESLEDHGVECDIVGVPGQFYANDEDFTRRSVWDYAKFYPKVLSNISDDYDIIHAHYGLTAPFALAQPHRPVVLSLWGRDLFGPISPITKACVKLCDEVIVRSDEMAQELDEEVHVVERGVDIDKFSPKNQDIAQQEVGWDPNKKHVLFPYSPKRSKKNYPLAEEVIEEVKQKHQARVELHTIHNEPHEKMSYYMNAADVLLLTSRPRSEGSPNTVKEALACNLSVVSTPVGDVESLLKGVENSFVCENKQEIIKNISQILEEGPHSNGRDKIKDLTWSKTSEQLITIYQKTLVSDGRNS